MPAGRPTDYREEFCELAETTLSKGYSLAVLAGECGVCHDTVKEWQKRHPEFSASIKRGRALGARVWEDRLAKLADAGVGNATGIIFGLKNRIPDEWKDKTEQEISGGLKVTKIQLVGPDDDSEDQGPA